MSQPQQVQASLGCGTLILIAIIVLVFGGHRDHEELEMKIDALQKEVQALRAVLTGEAAPEAE